MVLQEENHKKLRLGREERSEAVAAFSVTAGSTQASTTKRITYKQCEKFRHEETSSFEIIDYLAGWGSHGHCHRGHAGRGAWRNDLIMKFSIRNNPHQYRC